MVESLSPPLSFASRLLPGRLALACLCLALLPLPVAAVIVTSQVSAGNDDAEERVSSGNMSRGSTDLELVFDGSNSQYVGMRFRNVNVPAGVIITNAYIQFTVDETDSGSANVVVNGQLAANPGQFQNTNGDISSRTPTTNTVAWNNIPPWTTVGAQGVDQRTPNLSAIVSEIISLPGWAANNSMVFIVGAGTGCGSSACQRTAESENGSSSRAPILVIDYTTAPPTSADLSVTITDSPDPVDIGKLLQYTLTVSNAGPLGATGVTLTDTLPAGVGFVSASAGQGSCSEAGGTVSCALGSIAASGVVTVNIVVTAPGSAGSITNTATVSGIEPDPAGGNNSAAESTSVTSLNEDQLCYLVADNGGGSGGDDLLTRIDTYDFNPLTNETNIGAGTGTSSIEAIAWDRINSVLYAADAGRLGILNTTSGGFTPRPQTFGTGSGAAGNIALTDVDGLAFDATSGVLYGSHARGGAADLLFQIDRNTGTHVPNAFGPGVDYVLIQIIGTNEIVDDIAVDPINGVMYASVNNGGSTDRLIMINKATGAATDIAQITVQDIEGLGVDGNGNLWGSSGTQNVLYEIDKNTGVGFNGRPIDNGGDYESVDCYSSSPSIVADLAVTKTVDDATPALGGSIRYTVSVTNNGSGNATIVQLADSLPTGVSFTAASATQGSYDAQAGSWYVGNLNNAATATLLIDASVDLDAPAGAITNTAGIQTVSQSDPFPGNDSASVDIVPERPEIDVQKRVQTLSDPWSGSVNPKAIPGAVMRYDIVVSNNGAAAVDADSLVVTDPLPVNGALVVIDYDGSNPGPVAFIDGAPASGVSYTFISLASLTDDVEFSTDGSNFGYTPFDSGDGTDPTVTHLRVRPKGALAAGPGTGFELRFKITVD